MRLFRRRRTRPTTHPTTHPTTPKPVSQWKPEYAALADYNTRRSQGVMHDADYSRRMEEIQARYNRDVLGHDG